MTTIRQFDTGANRNNDDAKRDIEAFISPIVLKIYSDYMHENRYLVNGDIRDGDNWQKGIPRDVYMKCLQRHNLDVWLNHRGFKSREDMVHALCGVMFNAMGLLYDIAQEDHSLWEFEDGEL